MSEQSRNISQRPDEHYPAPGIPAEDAWKSMSALLDETMKPENSRPGNSLPAFIAGIVVVAVTALSIFFISGNSEKPTEIEATHLQTPFQPAISTYDTASISAADPTGASENTPTQTFLAGREPEAAPPLRPNNSTSAPKSVDNRGIPSLNPLATDNRPTSPPGSAGFAPLKPKKNSLLTTPLHPDYLPDRQTINPVSRLRHLPVLNPISGFPKENIKERSRKESASPSIRWGLQWNVNFPFRDGRTYYSDLAEKNGAYIPAIPGLWIDKELGTRQMLVLGIRPYFDYFTGNNPLYKQTLTDSLGSRHDSQTKEAYLRKLRSSSISANYHYEVINKLWLGAGLSLQKNWSGFGAVRRVPVRGGGSDPDSAVWFNRTDEQWKNIRGQNVTADIDISIQSGSFRWGGGLSVPLLPVVPSSHSFDRALLNGRLYIRWRLY